jgi:hypothetical protein
MHPFGAGTRTALALCLTCFGALPLLARLAWGDGPLVALAATAVGTTLFLAGCRRWRRRLALDSLRALRPSAGRPALPDPTTSPDPVR